MEAITVLHTAINNAKKLGLGVEIEQLNTSRALAVIRLVRGDSVLYRRVLYLSKAGINYTTRVAEAIEGMVLEYIIKDL